jgi:hypothetical protein
MVERQMNDELEKLFGRKWSWPSRDIAPRFPGETKQHMTSVSVAEISTET